MITIPFETEAEQIQRHFTTELREQMKKAALKLGVPVEMLKYRVDNMGIVEISVMDTEEAEDRQRQDILDSHIREIKKSKGLFYG